MGQLTDTSHFTWSLICHLIVVRWNTAYHSTRVMSHYVLPRRTEAGTGYFLRGTSHILAMADPETAVWKRPKLTGEDNYGTWSVSTEMALMKLKAWKVIDGEVPVDRTSMMTTRRR
jgi:hypothetical protein